VVNGKKVPARHLVTTIAVRAEAEYTPDASTTYAERGTIVSKSENPIKETDVRSQGAGSLYSAIHP